MGWTERAKGIVSNGNAPATTLQQSETQLGQKWRLSSMEGITESQAAACGEETDSRHAKGPCQVTLLNGDLQFFKTGISGAAQHQ